MKQSDVKINGHSVEYRVYAEDPARKFLPSIGFLRKYQEPEAHEHIRIDTGVEEGSEISMYYDPMISKLITWGKDRKEAHDLLDRAFDQYVIQGVTHNLGFGKSILANKSYASGNYSTSFIPDFYPEGYFGDKLEQKDQQILAMASFVLKELNMERNGARFGPKELYVEFPAADKDSKPSFVRVRPSQEQGLFEVTDVASGESHEVNISQLSLRGNALMKMDVNGSEEYVQHTGSKNDIEFKFYYKGAERKLNVYDHRQFAVAKHMPEPKVLDLAKSIISPMPGAVVSVSVEPGQAVQEGQELLVLEAMKMQNLIKSEVAGKIKNVHVKAGQSVGVDELLIEFE